MQNKKILLAILAVLVVAAIVVGIVLITTPKDTNETKEAAAVTEDNGTTVPLEAPEATAAPEATEAPAANEESNNGGGAAPDKDIVILFTSDVHCAINKGFTYAGLYAVKQELAKENYVALVDDGDSIQGEAVGAITKGEVDVKLMNALGYDAATFGNHEFDYGMDRLMELVAMAEYPYVSANFVKDGQTVVAPYIVKAYGDVKVAFVGATTPKTFTSSTPTYFQDENGNYIYGFCEDATGEKMYAAVQTAVDAARAEGADYVVVLAHLGIEETCSPWMSSELIANTTGINVLLDGHSHSIIESNEVKNKNGEAVLQAACGTKLESIGWCRISANGTISTGLYTWDSESASCKDFPELNLNNEFAAVVAEQTDAVNERLSQVVAHTDVNLIITDPETGVRVIRNLETNLGDLVADAYRTATGADVAMVNGGGIRANIEAGDITLGQIQACHPFGNALCMVEANGQQILDALEWTSRNAPGENGGFLQVSGITYEVHTYLPTTCTSDDKGAFTGVEGEYRVKNVMINGEPLDVTKTYTVASHNYMLKSGGDGTCMFTKDTVLLDEIKLDYETVIDYILNDLGGSVGADYAEIWGQGRIVIVNEAPAAE